MSEKNFKKNPRYETHDHSQRGMSTQAQMDKDDETTDREDWTPTPEQMHEYISREFVMAQSNLLLVMSNDRPMSFRDLKESTLHSVETLEKALAFHLKAGAVKESQGRFSLLEFVVRYECR